MKTEDTWFIFLGGVLVASVVWLGFILATVDPHPRWVGPGKMRECEKVCAPDGTLLWAQTDGACVCGDYIVTPKGIKG